MHTADSDSWDERLRPKFCQIIKELRPSSLLGLLFERHLIDNEQYKYLRSPLHYTEEERSRILLSEVLPKKGHQAFEKFCEVLLEVPDQAFIARDILRYHSATEKPGSRTVDNPSQLSGKKASSSETEKSSVASSSLVCSEGPGCDNSVLCSVVSDQLLFELADEVGVLWKELAMDFKFQLHEVDAIEKEAQTPRGRALKTLRQLRAKMSHTDSDFDCDEVRASMRKIKLKQYNAQIKHSISHRCVTLRLIRQCHFDRSYFSGEYL